ncbi:CRASP family complement regulator-acquiring lipoprotein (plasmid) [Borreliella andersonii]|uniref:CRASP family complement regulator-acquiring lipoprotein n=1 Tax=Borrelia andersonii TaxID=42109 RepID=A0ACD5G5V5_BORAD
MKYHIITSIFVFLFLACEPDLNIDQKDIKYPPTEKSRPKTEDSKQKESKPKTEEELRKKQQQEEEELRKKQQQEEEELKKKQQQQEEELRKKQQQEEELKKKQQQEEEELRKKQQQEEELRKKQQQEELKKKQQQQEEELRKKQQQEEEELRRKQQQEEEELKKKQQQEEELRRKQQQEEELRKKQQQEEELRKKQQQEEELRRKQQQEEELRKKQQQEEELRKKQQLKNKLLNDLKNLIEIANTDKEKSTKRMKEEPSDQYGILAFQELYMSTGKVSENKPEPKKFRENTYSTLSAIDDNKLKDLSEIIRKSGQIQGLFNIFNRFGINFNEPLNHVYSKKDTLKELEISDLEKLKNSFEKLLSLKATFTKMLNQLLLDYENDKDHIRTDTNKLKSYGTEFFNQLDEKESESYAPKNQIFSIVT